MGLYSWGANTFGQLSLGHCNDVHQITLVKNDLILSEESVESGNIRPVFMEGGANHMMIIDEKDDLYACGDNRTSQLFLSNPSMTDDCPSNIQENLINFVKVKSDVVSVACGWDFSVIVQKNGDVLHSKYSKIFSIDDFGGNKVCKVSCGVHHCFALTKNHILFGFGDNKFGELGSSIKNMNKRWIKVAEGVLDVKAGLRHSLLLMQDGTLRYYGQDKFRQNPIGIDQGNVLFIGSGWNHVVIITECSKYHDNNTHQIFYVNCYGKNDLGQLGHPDTALHHNQFALPFRPKDLKVGSEHAMILLENGQIMIWGWNEHGTCAPESKLTIMPRILNIPEGKVTTIGCTFAGCFAFVG